MPVISIQCPNCGAPVEADRLGVATCTSCGSTLRIASDSSGDIVPELVVIGQDTGFIAKRAAAARLKERLAELYGEQKRLEQAMSVDFEFGCLTSMLFYVAVPVALVGLVCLFNDVGLGLGLLVGGIALVGIPFLIDLAREDREKERLKAEYMPLLEPVVSEIREREGQLQRLEESLDRLTRMM